ncbi:hypothetical protein EVG20_g6825 [Dentipellis fragilis]|uniref:Uncharacterized protein n=1 Tax=Dentipellis fragilis TaxID=205917 RepID=A0A4Y9YKV5_9AGAM|nr:hypothetical protein EVG20_g6825 [Dentipellis fragilis]
MTALVENKNRKESERGTRIRSSWQKRIDETLNTFHIVIQTHQRICHAHSGEIKPLSWCKDELNDTTDMIVRLNNSKDPRRVVSTGVEPSDTPDGVAGTLAAVARAQAPGRSG